MISRKTPLLLPSDRARQIEARMAAAASPLVHQAVLDGITGYVRVQADLVAGRLLCLTKRIENKDRS